MNRASSDARKAKSPATSSGLPSRPNGILLSHSRSISGVYSASCIGVKIYPGQTALTLTLDASSRAVERGELDDTRLGGVVGGVPGIAKQSVCRAHVENHAAFVFDHPAGSLLSHIEDSVEIHFYNFIAIVR